ncbi:heparan-alpha-glucosaminide N-acetyltransferase domain-containing protein [Streptomyces alkaliterrae]|uniref:DUF1624 domain-containing protein n=1 Tax=Streptomyces alkaliterrae TaxID=2213162 RepID=A0A5P0YVX9_9ACTN|nr:heparan-alpha-glucosaminide N-acetyltransferase domain-containing protein [Streptomyces alkaliterrae]MBB1255985.1 DUF1624 domain-containing protein [Streptomyces alkaliterrae]MBB1259958.1 DUF1624 domain-containing protein [Streptomyces alkaliterrae]MQS04448.1 DUF1624 domain-containing protein [Streptomyces alkaliterrae]
MSTIAPPDGVVAAGSEASGAPPTKPPRRRIPGIDLARGIAVIGMFGAHTLMTGELGWHPSTWDALVNGRSSILFATLAGVSVALLSGGSRPYDGEALRDARTRILVRAVLLLAIGSLLTMLGSIAVILEVYAVLLAVSVLFLRWRPRRLFVGAAITGVCGAAVAYLLNGALSIWEMSAYDGVVGMTLGGVYPALVWMAFVLLGLGVGRLDLTARRVQLRLVAAGLVMALAGYGGGWVSEKAYGVDRVVVDDQSGSKGSVSGSFDDDEDFELPDPVSPEEIDFSGLMCSEYEEGYVSCEPEETADGEGDGGGEESFGELFRSLPESLAGWEPHSGTPFEVVGSSGVALLILGLCLLAPSFVRRPLYPVAAAGSMALTLYAGHAIALKIAADNDVEQSAKGFALLTLGALVFAVVWRRWLKQGPLERLLTSLSKRATRATVRHRALPPQGSEEGSVLNSPATTGETGR